MLRSLSLAALLLALGAGAAPARVAGGTPVAFVALEKDAQLVGVDLTERRVVARIAVPAGPRNITTTGDHRHLLVASPRARTVTLVDSFARRVVKTFRGFGRPIDVAVRGSHAFVTDARRNELVVIDLDRRRIAARIRVPRRPQNVDVGDVALVTHGIATWYVTVLYLSLRGWSHVRLGRVLVPVPGAGDVSRRPDSANAYVILARSGSVAAIDWASKVAFWASGGAAQGFVQNIAFDYFNGNRVWVSNPFAGEVFSLSSRTGRQLRRLRGCPGAGPIVLGGEASVLASCRDAGALAIWDTRTWKRTLVPVGDAPHGVAVAVVP